MRRAHAAVVVAVAVGAVGADGHGDPERTRLAHRIAQRPHHVQGAQLQRDVVRRIAARVAERAHDRERGHEEGALLAHQRQRLVIDIGAVLDAAHAGAHRGVRALPVVGMRRDMQAVLGRLGHRGTQFIMRELLSARIRAGEPGALAGADLDDISTPVDDGAHHCNDLIRPLERRLQVLPELRVAQDEGLAELRAHMTARHQHLRAGNTAVADEVARGHPFEIVVAEHTRGRHTGGQRAARRGRVLDVRVQVDEARHEERPAQVDGTRTVGCRGDLCDAAVVDAQVDRPYGRPRTAVDEPCVAEPKILRGRRTRQRDEERDQRRGQAAQSAVFSTGRPCDCQPGKSPSRCTRRV